MQFYDDRIPMRIWNKVMPEPMTGCWLWTASLTPGGYSQTSWGDKLNKSVHRVMYETLIGPVTKGLDLDHLCRVRSCCNPHHLEPVTRSVNLKRGEGGDPGIGRRRGDQIRARTACIRGHAYTSETPMRIVHGRSSRYCMECDAIRRGRRA